MKNLFLFLFLSLIVFSINDLAAQCDPPITPPLFCNSLVHIFITPGDTFDLYPDPLLEGGPYCYDSIWLEFNPPAMPALFLELDETDIGMHTVLVQQYSNGIPGNSCEAVILVESNCYAGPDTLIPTAICKSGWTLEVSIAAGSPMPPSFSEVLAQSFNDDSRDNCTAMADLDLRIEFSDLPSAVPPTTTSVLLDSTHIGVNDMVMWVIDESGNWDFCTSTLTLNVASCFAPVDIHLPADFFPNDPILDSFYTTPPSNEFFTIESADEPFDFDCDGQVDKIIRTWTVLDWCAQTFNGPLELMPMDINNDGISGDAYEVRLEGDSIYLLENGVPDTPLSQRNPFFFYQQTIYEDTYNIELKVVGKVFIDSLANCSFDLGEIPLEGWQVRVTGLVSGETRTANTNALGEYDILICSSDTLVEVSLSAGFNYGQNCPTTYTLAFDGSMNETLTQNISVQFDSDCPLIHVDISVPKLKLCSSQNFIVNYCNLSDQPISGAFVEVTLDTFLTFLNSPVPSDSVGPSTWAFDLGILAPGECGSFWLETFLDCNAPMGMTHCANAHFFPDTLCPNISNWTGANIEVEGFCENDEVHLIIKNTGDGNMTAPLEFVIIEDVIMYLNSNFQLNSNDIFEVPPMPAGGATWRIEANQEVNHPFPGSVATAVEGCDGLNIPGLVNLFPLENPSPFIANFCLENVSSFDPNDMQAFPVGYGPEHFIEKNTVIEYLIRFQNTGTDTANKVVLLDTLPLFLDPLSVRPGTSSHPFHFELLDGNVLRFTFDPIELPDSNANLSASQGYIQFSIHQYQDLALGTVIENNAAIYFDFNDPVITNTVFHTIGEKFIEVINSTTESPIGLGELLAYPNPSVGDVTFKIPGAAIIGATFIFHDALGKQLKVEPFADNIFRFGRGGLAPGIYFYAVEVEGLGRYAGKIVLK